MTSHDISPEFFGLVRDADIARFRFDEAQFTQLPDSIRPSDLIANYISHTMSGSAHLSHVGRRFVFTEHTTYTSDIYSIIDRGPRWNANLPRVTSIIVPHDTEIDRIAEWHLHDVEHPHPLAAQEYRTLQTIHQMAQAAIELSR